MDSSGYVYVADTGNHRIRKINSAGVVTTFAGSTEGFADGTGNTAQFKYPSGVAVDSRGNVYVADSANNRIRKITPTGVVSTFAGTGTAGFAEGAANTAQFNHPAGVAVDSSGYVYVADYANNRIRKITPAGVVSTLVSTAQLNYPTGVAVDSSGNVYVADRKNHRIRKITPEGVVTTFAGRTSGYKDGTGTEAQFKHPGGVAVDSSGTVFVADTANNRIRKIEYKVP